MATRQNLTDLENDPAKVGTQYTVRNPHPGFGTDPNIKNEVGHTNYPKWIDHPWKKQVQTTTTYIGRDQTRNNQHETNFPEQVWVADEAEEKKVLAEKDPNAKQQSVEASWPSKDKK